MKKLFVLLFVMSLVAISSFAIAAGTLEEGMQELAQQIVKNSMAKGKKSIAISSFPHTNGDQSELSNYLADELVLKLFSVPESNLEIIERGQLNRIFQEMQLSMTGVIDVKTIQKLGKVHGVDALVLGSITEMGESIRINARLTDTETGRVFSAAGTTIPKTSTTAELLSRILTVANNSSPSPNVKSKSGSKPFAGTSGSFSNKKKIEKDEGQKVFKVDLNRYDMGDIPEELGVVMIAMGKYLDGKKVIKGFQGGSFKINLPVSLRKNFEVTFTAEFRGASAFTLRGSEKHLNWKVLSSSIKMKDTSYKSYSNDGIFRIVSKGRVVKLFIDDKFVGTQLHEPNSEYNSFEVDLKNPRHEITDIVFIQK